MNAEEYLRQPFTLHFYGISISVVESYTTEGLPQPFTTLHYLSLVRKSDIRSPSASQSFYRFSFFFVAHHFSAKLFGYTICLPRKNSQVKGGEG